MHPRRWIRVDFSHGKLQSVCLSNTGQSAPSETARADSTLTEEGVMPQRGPGHPTRRGIRAGKVPADFPLLSAKQMTQRHGGDGHLPRRGRIVGTHEHL